MSDEMRYRPDCYQREYVETPGALERTCLSLAGVDAIGVDIEMGQRVVRHPGGVQEWRHILALIQVASDEVSLVIDPLRCSDLTPLGPILAGGTTKVFLGGGQDVALLDAAGVPAENVVDVGEVAYSVFGRREDGMAALAKRIFGLSLDKTVRRADWLVRPLNPALISYAFQDAELTLLIYRWFGIHYPDVLSMHRRRQLEPTVPASVPAWLRDAILRGSSDAQMVVAEHGLDVSRDHEAMSEAIRQALVLFERAPRRVNRLVRVAGDLGLRELFPDIRPLVSSPSSLLRASAARATAKLAEKEEADDILRSLQEDPIEDVRKAADAGLRELKGKKREPQPAEPEEVENGPTLAEESLAALQEMMKRLEGESS